MTTTLQTEPNSLADMANLITDAVVDASCALAGAHGATVTLVYNVDPLRNPIDPADPLNGAHGSLVNALHQVAAAQRALANAAAALSPWVLAVTGDEGAF